MKKFLSLALALIMLFSLMAPSSFAEESYDGKTVIMYTGNIRGELDVYAKVAAAKAAYESAGADVVLADAGNFMQGSAAANTDRGLSVYNLMDAVGYDVAAMGLAEFGYVDATTGYKYHSNYTRYHTQAQLQTGAEEETYGQNYKGDVTATLSAKEAASFKTVSANVKAAESDPAVYAFDASTVVTTKAGLKIGFYGITDPAVAENVQDGFIDSVAQPAATTVDGADITVCLSNAGLSGDGYGDILIDAKTGGIMMAGAYLVDNKTKTVSKIELDLSNTDADVAAQVKEIKDNADKVVGKSSVILNGADSSGWNGETNLGDLVADALAWYAKNYIDGVDKSLPIVAIQNGGNCDNFIYTGDITETDLLKALPFSPMGVGVLVITGAQLLETLEAATQSEACPGFAQVSGIEYTVNTAISFDAGEAYGKFYKADSVNRVTINSVNGKAFDASAKYALVSDNFLLNGNDTYYTLKEAKAADDAVYINNGNGVKTRDIVAMYIDKVLGGTVGSDYASAQGRITVKDTVDLPFVDVNDGHFYSEAVAWAYTNEVTKGVDDTHFMPYNTCTRAEAVTFLWRASGCPEPTSADSMFTDINSKSYYYKAVLWATENGITKGTSETTFDPNATVTRAQVVTFLYRLSGSPVVSGGSFSDVPAASYYSAAVQWAVANKITNGTGNNMFSPGENCSRSQIVTFLYRFFVK